MFFSRRFVLMLMVSAMALTLGACASKPPVFRPPFNHHYTHWGRVLAQCVTPDGFRYEVLKADPSALVSQLGELAIIDEAAFAGFNREERLAFLINAHNMYASWRIAEDYPVKSIGQTSIFWPALRRKDIWLAGKDWSLLSLREEILGPKYGDSRALFALNWGMRGCSPLSASPITPENMRDVLERQTQLFVRNPQYCKYEPLDRRVYASPLLRDYREIIERDYTTLWGFMRHFASPRHLATLESEPPKFEWMEFDKGLNGADMLPAAPKPSQR